MFTKYQCPVYFAIGMDEDMDGVIRESAILGQLMDQLMALDGEPDITNDAIFKIEKIVVVCDDEMIQYLFALK
jgi:hypothetical protein